ncbi:bifunctional diguanylate cyclase/phosphodiesterase [Sulfurimonas sp.]|uniref:EAL domain-containing protein n=1 Tax=Sulfurimonas sp. TaxID=2022749 RepID=UPI0025F0613A|nr:bifunctional diguanylate cyclase/phosphodiesterase [Sulfurimonas sp.]MDD5156850.1 bifunctional diguanylate cyclase/phosphodiesterase [Sulfurimonas sp.]
MSLDNSEIEISEFILNSSNDIDSVIKSIEIFQNKRVLVHIVSFIHNTVLVQNLKDAISKKLQNSQIVLLKHENRNQTNLVLYSLDSLLNIEDINHDLLQKLFVQTKNKDLIIEKYRDEIFSRYFTDHLTNLPNVYKLRSDLDDRQNFALVIFNIDNFQMVNNFYGYIIGDYVIEHVGKYLKKNLPQHTLYRYSGDEFAFIMDENIGFYELKEYLSSLYEKLKNIVIEYQDIKIYIDFTLASCANADKTNIFSKVSMALKYAKESGKDFWIYENRMNFENDYERNLMLSGIIRDAVVNSRIIPYFQAIVDSRTGEISKYECLARLVDKNEKIISPTLFIPVAKKIKLYKDITKIMIDKSFETFENNEFEFSINLSIEDIVCYELFEFIVKKLKNSKASNRVVFELLESDAIEDFVRVERFVSEVRRYGAKIAIDDFGSGYSNFKYLTQMNPDYIKIDGTLIQNIDIDTSSLFIVETIVEFANKLGIKTIAEYVHSSTVFDIVRNAGVNYSQGFYIDSPSVSLK